ncbi:MAG: bifunctional folylpolyglutamate synthase/dihydrofolate synthase [Flavobacteriaceae bacterium]|nr:bifunctional folylpolyglutamate synthase/dihydrofolate synthase [Flavobacteriaceae bacterium]
MNYNDTVNWMFSKLPMYQRQGASAFKKDLTNTNAISEHLGNPHHTFKSIHVAGTNGKGSTSHMLASILQEAGYKVGLYTSPHLKDFRERIKINGEMISKNAVINFVKKNQSFLEKQQLSFFEMTVGLAFDYFAKQKVDIAVVEVGLGGRLDSTNIITPVVSVITNIGLDHTQMLGDTLEKIAFEKAGIIKENIPVVIGERQEETEHVFIEIAKNKSAPIYFAEDKAIDIYESDLKGNYQQKNIKTVVGASNIVKEKGFTITEKHVKNGLLCVVKNTGLQGRWQILQEKPKVICDTAHNREGLTYVMQQLREQHFNKLHIVLGVVNDKDLQSVLPLFPKDATYYFCKPDVPRGLEVQILQEKAKEVGLLGKRYDSVREAHNEALKSAATDDLIFVGGSTFVVAEVV